MKTPHTKIFFIAILFTGLTAFASKRIYAQVSPQRGISYQALLHDETGNPMRNQLVQLRIKLTAAPSQNKIYYVENQQLQTTDRGIVNLIIGSRANGQNLLRRVPWAEQDIWMEVELLKDNGDFQVVSHNSFYAVPYAFYAETADSLVVQDTSRLRTDQSITWNVRGNYKTDPNIHFLGTADANALFFKTNNTTRLVITAEGQSTYYTDPGVTGEDDDKKAYPVVIQGGAQGMYIELQESRSTANNFLTFADTEGIHGTVEGQTGAEFYGSSDYLSPLAVQLTDIALSTANLVAGTVEEAGLALTVNPAAAVKAIGLAEVAAALAEQTAALAVWKVQTALSIGVSYTTGNADYAEWLEKANPGDDLLAGEIVGVKNGKVSRHTQGADHLLVVSHRPLALGNVPESAEAYKYEKVALKGQVRVFVVGPVNRGDYILPSGNDDGMAIAVAPDKMKVGDYHRIIGVAWQNAINAPMNMVNVAVGLNTNDLAGKVKDIEDKLTLITDYLNGNAVIVDGQIVASSDAASQGGDLAEQTRLGPFLSDEQYNQFLEDNAELYEYIFHEAEQHLAEMGVDISQFPLIRAMYDDPLAFLKAMRQDSRLQTQMGYFDQLISRMMEDNR